ncbi:hypothetical protein OAQ08_02305 [Alphaproteobacteria bacterium]|nr:hypothetical protein [Alphaproteobacteria bacterium]
MAHIVFLLPMVSLSFNKDKITDVPLILPVEMFIIEDKTAAPEFKQEINEVIPDRVEQIPKKEQEVVKENNQIQADEEILASESVEEDIDFSIEKKTKPEEPIEEKLTEVKNDFEIKLKKKPEPKEIIEKEEVKIVLEAKPKKKSFNVSKVLKDIEQESKDFKKEQETTEETQSEVFTDEVGEKMTISEVDVLTQQLISCYTVPAGAKELEKIKIQVQILVNPDRTINDANIKNIAKMQTDPYYRTAGEAALRAFKHPNCSVLMLPEGKYEMWKEINFTFDFSWMFDQV